MIRENVEGSKDPSNPNMDSKQILTEAINNLNKTLDDSGIYVTDYRMVINSPSTFSSIDDLRSAAINKQASIVIELEAFISNGLWRRVEPENPYLKLFDMQIESVENLDKLIKETFGDEEDNEQDT